MFYEALTYDNGMYILYASTCDEVSNVGGNDDNNDDAFLKARLQFIIFIKILFYRNISSVFARSYVNQQKSNQY